MKFWFLSILTLLASFNVFSQSPGGVSTNLHAWWKADLGVTGTTSVTTWEDQSGQNFHLTGTNGPALIKADANYQSSISFDGTNDEMVVSGGIFGTGSYSDLNVIIVNKTNKVQNSFIFYEGLDSGERFGSHIPWGNSQVYYDLGKCCGSSRIQKTWGTSIDNYHIWTLSTSTSTSTPTGTRKAIHRDGQEIVTNNNTDSGVGKNSNFNLGSSGGKQFHPGNIAEFIIFNTTPTASELQKIHTYLALKYGITLSTDNDNSGNAIESPNSDGIHEGDYLSSSGTVIWDASNSNNFQNDILGIARDDNSGLQQKQSRSVDDSIRVYLDNLVSQNSINAGTFSSDRQFILLAHNGEDSKVTSAASAEIPVNMHARIGREWKITNTNFDGTFSIQWLLADTANFGSFDSDDLRLLVDSDGDFGDASDYGETEGLTFSFSNGTVTINDISTAQVPINASSFITLASASSNTLPIELLSFNAVPEDKKVKISWETATEVDNDFFTIERSRDAQNWEFVSIVEGAGNSSELLYYETYDNAPLPGLNYYRLKQTDFDSQFSYSEIRNVNIETVEKSNLKLYPNPSTENGEINLMFKSTEENPTVLIKIIDRTGRPVQMRSFNIRSGFNAINLNLQSIPPGNYYIYIDQAQAPISKPFLIIKS